ncbi:MAG TPA: hypothetical protein PKI15_04455 [Candidatus Cloacimonadota bacterium]|nr:hypothetical protein [Candidatus Cloacimonadota bacterium]
MLILFALALILYTVFFLINFVTAETPLFFKMLPLAIFFVGLDSLFRHVFGLNSVTFFPERIELGFLGKPAIKIPYPDLLEMELHKQITIYLYLTYKDHKGREQKFRIKGSFPKVLEIILGIYEMVPQIRMNEKTRKTCEYLQQCVVEKEGQA